MTPTYAADYAEQRSRLTTFFRILLVIPHIVVIGLWSIAIFFTVIAAWFALVITGRYPAGLYEFNASFARCCTAFYGYYYLLTDDFPPFGGDTDRYPVRLHVGPPKAQYSRGKALVRIVLLIPVYIIMYVMSLVSSIGAFIAWFAIVVLGRQPRGLQDMISLGVSYQARASAYALLLSEDFPPFQSPPELTAGGGGQGFSSPQTAF